MSRICEKGWRSTWHAHSSSPAPPGHTGHNTVKTSLEAGVNVRAFVHREDERSEALHKLGAETITGNILDFESVRAAVEGVEGAYIVFPIVPGIMQETAYFAQEAREASLKSVVNMSQISARREAKSRAAQDHWLAEQVFQLVWSPSDSSSPYPL